MDSQPNVSLDFHTRIPLSSSARSLSDVLVSPLSAPSRSSSTSSVPFAEGEVDVVTEEGLRHTTVKLNARHYKSQSFRSQLLEVLRTLLITPWLNQKIVPDAVKIHKVSGSLTNAVFFVSCPSVPLTSTVLLRIYGPSSGSLICRSRELHTLHALSSQYHIGPTVYGTFENGRVEEYFDSVTLTPEDIRDKKMSRLIGARMAELHSVDIAVVQGPLSGQQDDAVLEIGVKRNVDSWLMPAREVLAMPGFPEAARIELDLNGFEQEWQKYMCWLSNVEKTERPSRRVFSHNDAQCGNLLRLTHLEEGSPEHHQIIVVDFEYASLNPAAFDIANHFHEWTTNYSSSHILDPTLYPTFKQRCNFYLAYLNYASFLSSSSELPNRPDRTRELEIQILERQVHAWSPASHGMWAVWSIVQAREDIEGAGEEEFDYVGYAKCRMQGFRNELKQLGI